MGDGNIVTKRSIQKLLKIPTESEIPSRYKFTKNHFDCIKTQSQDVLLAA